VKGLLLNKQEKKEFEKKRGELTGLLQAGEKIRCNSTSPWSKKKGKRSKKRTKQPARSWGKKRAQNKKGRKLTTLAGQKKKEGEKKE